MSKWRKKNHGRERGRLVTRLLARDGVSCTICGEVMDRRIKDGDDSEYVTIDHIRPRSRGGTDDLDNLRLAHQRCNRARGNDWEPDGLPGE